jgi:hypothetical protein
MVAACLAALAGDRHGDAALTLPAIAEPATSRGRTRASPESRARAAQSSALSGTDRSGT